MTEEEAKAIICAGQAAVKLLKRQKKATKGNLTPQEIQELIEDSEYIINR